MRTWVCGIAVLAIATSVNALPLADGGFEDAGSPWTIQNVGSGLAGSMGSLVSGWKVDVDRPAGSGTLGGTISPYSASQFNTGTHSLQISYTGRTAWVSVYQMLSGFPDGTTVNWTYAMKPVTLQTANCFIEVGYIRGVANGVTTVDPNATMPTKTVIRRWDAFGNGLPTVGSWNTGSGSFTMSGNSTGNVAYFVRIGGNANAEVYFDDLSFYTPEPASLILLALGLPMLRRCR